MSEKQMEKLVDDFLKRVKKRLPGWLTDKKREVKDIMNELESHIWEKAEDLSETRDPTMQSMKLAIAQMGTPSSIAREYKKRGTPKIYITEELWPYYIKVLKVAAILIVIGFVVGFIVNIILGDIEEALGIFNVFNVLFFVFAIITVIFVALSMEGYLPEDFISEKDRKKREKEKKKAEEKGFISPKTGKIVKPFIQPTEKIVGGIIGLIAGAFFVSFTVSEIAAPFNSQFLMIIRVFGIFILIDGGLTLIRGIVGEKQVLMHQVFIVVTAVLKIASIWFLLMIYSNPEIVSILYFEGNAWKVMEIPLEYFEAFKNAVLIIIIIQGISALVDLYKAGQLEKYKLLIE
ncbi:MAG: HAAS signaling domain-containing protein [Promethearchaeia archaeon]